MNKSPRRLPSFVLLEVLVALVILAVTLTAVLRGFLMANHALKENLIILQATYLADSLLQDFELEPPLKGREEGDFGDDPRFGEAYAAYSYAYEVDEERLRYRDVPKKTLQEPEPLYTLKLSIFYNDGNSREFEPVHIETFMLEPQVFSANAIQTNQLF